MVSPKYKVPIRSIVPTFVLLMIMYILYKRWRTLEPTNRSNSSLLRALKLKGLVEGRTKEQNPAVKVANTALDEYFTPGGSIEKAAFAIELALKPALNHPSPLPLHGIRGYVPWYLPLV